MGHDVEKSSFPPPSAHLSGGRGFKTLPPPDFDPDSQNLHYLNQIQNILDENLDQSSLVV